VSRPGAARADRDPTSAGGRAPATVQSWSFRRGSVVLCAVVVWSIPPDKWSPDSGTRCAPTLCLVEQRFDLLQVAARPPRWRATHRRPTSMTNEQNPARLRARRCSSDQKLKQDQQIEA
jgi:hypothetical protein